VARTLSCAKGDCSADILPAVVTGVSPVLTCIHLRFHEFLCVGAQRDLPQTMPPQVLRPRPLSKDHPNAIPPALINSDQRPVDLRRDVAQHGIGRRMNMQRRRHQEQERLLARQFLARKIPKLLKLAARMMPFHSRPVIQTPATANGYPRPLLAPPPPAADPASSSIHRALPGPPRMPAPANRGTHDRDVHRSRPHPAPPAIPASAPDVDATTADAAIPAACACCAAV